MGISEKANLSMLADVDDAHINISENQEKVIRNKYIKDDPSVEIWLRRIARNIASNNAITKRTLNVMSLRFKLFINII